MRFGGPSWCRTRGFGLAERDLSLFSVYSFRRHSMPHYITQRGNGRNTGFDTDADCTVYPNLLPRKAIEYRPMLWVWSGNRLTALLPKF